MGRYSGTSGVFNEGAFGGSIDISEEGIQKEFADVHGLEFPYELDEPVEPDPELPVYL